jgi:hypothetical protein
VDDSVGSSIIELFSLYHNYYHWRGSFTVCQKSVSGGLMEMRNEYKILVRNTDEQELLILLNRS